MKYTRIRFDIAGILSIMMIMGIQFACKSTRVTQTPPKPVVTAPAPPPPKTEPVIKENKKPEKVKGRFVLILPFELEANFVQAVNEITEPEINQLSLAALNFYEGALMAVDSLKLQNVEIKLNTFDAPADSVNMIRMLTNPVVKDATLVIGTFPNHLAHIAASMAKQQGINLVLTQASSPEILKDNDRVSLAFASTITQCREMVAFMLNQFRDPNIILVYRNMKREDELANIFREAIQKKDSSLVIHEFNATKAEYTEMVPLLSQTKRNVIFIVSSGEAFVNPLLALLESQNIFGIKVGGLPTWLNFESIDFMSFNNVQTYLFDNNYIDTETSPNIQFRRHFIARYHNDPLPTAYNGFDLVHRYGKAISEQDTMSVLTQRAFSDGNSQFQFVKPTEGGLENKSISIFLVQEYKLQKQNQ